MARQGCLALGQGQINDRNGIESKGGGRGFWMAVLLLLHMQLHLQLVPVPLTVVCDVVADVAVAAPGTVAAVDGPP